MTTRVLGMELSDGTSLVLAVVGACVASLVIAVCMTELLGRQTPWLAEAGTSCVAAAVWMGVGRRFAPRTPAATIVVFLVGAAAAWFFSRGIVHSVSPYYGLSSIAAAVGGASVVWMALARDAHDRWRSVVVPVATIALIASCQLATPSFGVTRTLWQADGHERVVHVTAVNALQYIWTAAPLTASERVRVEIDPGSGPSGFVLQPVDDAATRAMVCERFAQDTRTRITTEVADGVVPAFVTRLAYRSADCADGRVWALIP